MARPERFELPAYCSGGNRSIHLSYGRARTSSFYKIITKHKEPKTWVVGHFEFPQDSCSAPSPSETGGEGAMVADGGRESERSTQTPAPAGRNELAQGGSPGTVAPRRSEAP